MSRVYNIYITFYIYRKSIMQAYSVCNVRTGDSKSLYNDTGVVTAQPERIGTLQLGLGFP